MKRPRSAALALLVASSLAVGVDASAQPAASPSGAPITTAASDRSALAVTIYNNGFGLVREKRKIRFAARGRVRVSFTDVAPLMLAPSVSLVPGVRAGSLSIVEQAFRYDVLSPADLLRRADGSAISILRVNPGSGDIDRVSGTALAGVESNGVPVLRTSEGITFYERYSAIAFPTLPARWSSRPSLAWLLDVRAPGDNALAVSYLTRGMRWSADYVLVLGKAANDPANLVGWITLVNR